MGEERKALGVVCKAGNKGIDKLIKELYEKWLLGSFNYAVFHREFDSTEL